MRIWEAATGKQLWQLRGEKPIRCLAFSRNGRILAAGDGYVLGGKDYSIRLYDAESGTQIGCPLKFDYEVSSVAYSPDGSKLAAAHYKTVSIFNMETNEVLCTVRGHRYAPSLSKECFLSLG